MTVQHKYLAQGRWRQLPVCEQMANIGSEAIRALNWRKKGNEHLSQKASARALELIDLSLDSAKLLSRIKEFARFARSSSIISTGRINSLRRMNCGGSISITSITWRENTTSFREELAEIP